MIDKKDYSDIIKKIKETKDLAEKMIDIMNKILDDPDFIDEEDIEKIESYIEIMYYN